MPCAFPSRCFGGALHVEVERIHPDEEIVHLGHHGLAEPCEALRGEKNAGEASLPPPAHEIDDGAGRRLSHRGSDSALAAERREQVNLVDGNDGWVP